MTSDRARVFVALEVPAPAREALATWTAEVLVGREEVRQLSAQSLHVTLCFLGAQPVQQLEAIAQACAPAADRPPMELGFGSVLWLPPRRPRVLAVELLDPSGELGRLQMELVQQLVQEGWYQREHRPYLPHVTVGRVRPRTRPDELDPPRAMTFLPPPWP